MDTNTTPVEPEHWDYDTDSSQQTEPDYDASEVDSNE